MRVLITGSAGYVGHQIAQRLARAGVTVLGTSRRAFSLPSVEIHTGDHLDANFIASTVSRCDCVLHFAARTRGHAPQQFQRDNEAVTKLLCREATKAGKRLIYVSSDQAVYQTGHYGRSKLACEEIVRDTCDEHTTLRLTAVLGSYAPEMPSTFSKIIKRLHEARFITVPGSCEFQIAPIWIGDIERVIMHLLSLDRLPNDTFEVCGPQLSLADLIGLFEHRLGVKRRRLRLPLWPLQTAARILKPLRVFARLPLDALIDLGSPVLVSPYKLQEMTGITPMPMSQAVPLIEDFPRPQYSTDTPQATDR
jgi:2-alkyl-3-oxoalkanoate reductase